MKKQAVITMDDKGGLSINGNVSSVELLGLIRLGETVILKDMMAPRKSQENVPTPPVELKDVTEKYDGDPSMMALPKNNE